MTTTHRAGEADMSTSAATRTTVGDPADLARRRELAEFLRSQREALDPAEAGGAINTRRRAKGWLREEVAFAAGISSTWYMWLEQARPVRASPRVLDGLARALKLDSIKRAYLFRLARPDLQPGEAGAARTKPGEGLIELVNALSPHPAYVLDARWDMVAWNGAAEFLLGGIDARDKWSYNLIGRMFTDPRMRTLMSNWEELAASSIGQFRSTTAGLADDPEHRTLVDALENGSAEFRAIWQSRRLTDTPDWRKTFRHPVVGEVTFRYSTLQPMGPDSPFRVTIYTPASPDDASSFTEAFARRA
jgi:transcriptional regulator with XRE-family HTH domain